MPDPDNLEPFTTPVLGHEIYALRSKGGEGLRPIFLIHGAIASRRYMVPTATLLAKNFQVYVPDLPGHGASSKPPHALTVKEQAEVLQAWMEKLGLKNAVWLANSYGCQIVAQLAVSYPEAAQRLILTDSTGDPTAPGLFPRFVRLAMDGFVEPFGAPLMMFVDIYDMGIRRTFETAERMKNDDIRAKLPLIHAKTLVVRGGKDPICPEKWGEQMVRLLPDASLVVIPDAPHSVNAAAADKLVALVDTFLAD